MRTATMLAAAVVVLGVVMYALGYHARDLAHAPTYDTLSSEHDACVRQMEEERVHSQQRDFEFWSRIELLRHLLESAQIASESSPRMMLALPPTNHHAVALLATPNVTNLVADLVALLQTYPATSQIHLLQLVRANPAILLSI